MGEVVELHGLLGVLPRVRHGLVLCDQVGQLQRRFRVLVADEPVTIQLDDQVRILFRERLVDAIIVAKSSPLFPMVK